MLTGLLFNMRFVCITVSFFNHNRFTCIHKQNLFGLEDVLAAWKLLWEPHLLDTFMFPLTELRYEQSEGFRISAQKVVHYRHISHFLWLYLAVCGENQEGSQRPTSLVHAHQLEEGNLVWQKDELSVFFPWDLYVKL